VVIHVEATALRIVGACAGKVAAVRTMAGLYRRSHGSLRDFGTASVNGSKDGRVAASVTCASKSLPLKSSMRRPCSRRFRRRT
jgi:hypothetical protein